MADDIGDLRVRNTWILEIARVKGTNMGILTKKHKQGDWAVKPDDLSEKKHGCGGSSGSSGGSFDAEPRDEKVRALIVTVQYH